MFDIATLQSTISGLQTAGQMAKAIHELSTSIDVKAKVIDLQASILSAQQSALTAQSDQFAMMDRIRQLEEEIANVKAWEKEKQRYHLVQPRGSAVFVYALKESCKGTDPPHWICTKCYDDGKRTILQPSYDLADWIHLICSTCKSDLNLRSHGPKHPEYAKT